MIFPQMTMKPMRSSLSLRREDGSLSTFKYICGLMFPENNSLNPPEEDPLENLLIEHPSMSVYQIRHQTSDEEDSDEEDASPRPVPVKQHVSWRLAAWGSPLPCNVQLLAIQQARTHVECKKLTRSAFQRQNLAKMRFSPSDRRFGHFKQPCQRLYNY
ncbi:tumor protein p53-inducible nuclear protein 2-like isoform 2-T2 [Salvelinus alpinus]|uniref:tumor protein p53-inducible nuclear protein 2-like isoform X2 n=1 Tax=Salvelinus alpinus TaxID=8036 RepID=UPI0039FC116E